MAKSLVLTVEEAAKSKNIENQTQLLDKIHQSTGVKMRPSTLSDMYRNSQTTINKKNLGLVMTALEIDDLNQIITLMED